ncbi:hypothetical protein J6590_038566 [Homalodisca vitripennis]|nr:hypothetical protein J6590_038566 [Homalodisca vitripennis]
MTDCAAGALMSSVSARPAGAYIPQTDTRRVAQPPHLTANYQTPTSIKNYKSSEKKVDELTLAMMPNLKSGKRKAKSGHLEGFSRIKTINGNDLKITKERSNQGELREEAVGITQTALSSTATGCRQLPVCGHILLEYSPLSSGGLVLTDFLFVLQTASEEDLSEDELQIIERGGARIYSTHHRPSPSAVSSTTSSAASVATSGGSTCALIKHKRYLNRMDPGAQKELNLLLNYPKLPEMTDVKPKSEEVTTPVEVVTPPPAVIAIDNFEHRTYAPQVSPPDREHCILYFQSEDRYIVQYSRSNA